MPQTTTATRTTSEPLPCLAIRTRSALRSQAAFCRMKAGMSKDALVARSLVAFAQQLEAMADRCEGFEWQAHHDMNPVRENVIRSACADLLFIANARL